MKVRFLAWSGDYGVFSVTWSDRSSLNALSVNVQIKADTASLRDGAEHSPIPPARGHSSRAEDGPRVCRRFLWIGVIVLWNWPNKKAKRPPKYADNRFAMGGLAGGSRNRVI